MNWQPSSWRNKPAAQQPEYDDTARLGDAEASLGRAPALVDAAEVEDLVNALKAAADGDQFILHAGDCAESFEDCHPEAVLRNQIALHVTAIAIERHLGTPVTVLARMAGQFAKPRSSEYETLGSLTLPAYRGDIINDHEFDEDKRRPCPDRMLRAYDCAKATLSLLSEEKSADAILRSLGAQPPDLPGVSLEWLATELAKRRDRTYVSHEALLLNYEEALTRQAASGLAYHAGSAHLLWVGDRTRQLDHAHLEYLSGIENPVGVKLGPSASADELLSICAKLNPDNRAGRLVLITRLGVRQVEQVLPGLIEAIVGEGCSVNWFCDPMHGNTQKDEHGEKTRFIGELAGELEATARIHCEFGTTLSGVHLEMTGADVLECVASAAELPGNYVSKCDPRLNLSQALHLVEALRRADP